MKIHADGHCIPKKDAKGYARITDEEGKSLMKAMDFGYKITTIKMKQQIDCVEVFSNDTPYQQINYAEIMALKLALLYALKFDVKHICIDSVTSNAWSQGRIPEFIKDEVKRQICRDCTKLRMEFEKSGGKIKKISGNENKADFGLHKHTKKKKKHVVVK